MLNRSILTRGAFIGLLLVGLMVLADAAVRRELLQAAGDMTSAPATEYVQTAGASDE